MWRCRARCVALPALQRRFPQHVHAQQRLLVVRRAHREVEKGALERVQLRRFGEAAGVDAQRDRQRLRQEAAGGGGGDR